MSKKQSKPEKSSQKYVVRYTCAINGKLKQCGDEVDLSAQEARLLKEQGKVA